MVQRSLSGMHPIETARLVIANAEPLVPALGASATWLDPQDKYFGTEPQLIHVNGELTGRFPVWLSKWRYGLPLRVLLSWQTPLTFAGTPYIREDHVDETLAAFLTQDGPSAFLFNAIPVSGPFWDNLVRMAGQLDAPVRLVSEWQRAALQPTGSFNDWFENNFERKRRKEYRRLRARLAETGKLECLRLTPQDNVNGWLDRLLDLEAKGWKGRTGTAVAADEATVNCLRESLQSLQIQGNLRFWNLALDGRPLAMMFAMVEGSHAWLGKIAFDEEFAKYSPGVLLVLDATEDLFADPAIKLVDSCAIPGHPMIDHIWRDRLHLGDVLIGRPGMSPAQFRAIAFAENLRRTGREKLKDLYYRVKQRHRS